MGDVFLAEDTKLKRKVALKFLIPHLTRDKEAKERFIQEAQTASALDHPNICTIYEINETKPAPGEPGDSQLFIAMAYYEGETLNEKIDRGPLHFDEATEIAVQVAQGLTKAHEQGVVHRDIKPANIHITNDGVVKILDFGLAKLAGRTKLTKSGTTIGTAAYMSPEQARGKEVDFRTDIWSLGVVLYEMVTGQLPFRGDYELAVINCIINEVSEPMTNLRTRVPIELERIVNKTLVKSPNERYQHVNELLTALNISKTECLPTIKAKKWKIVKKTPRKKIAISVGILFLLIIGFFLVRFMLLEGVLVPAPIPIAVLPLENRIKDAEYGNLGVIIQDLLITKLDNSKYLSVTTRERMYDIRKQLGKEDHEINNELGLKLCQFDGVQAVVVGSINKAGDTFVTDVKVLELESLELIESASAKGKGVNSILDRQVDELGKKLSRIVGLPERKIKDLQQPIAEGYTASTDAYNYYVKGREEIYQSNFDDARRYLERAIQLDSTFAAAYLELYSAYRLLGKIKARDNALKKANAFAKKAPFKVMLQIEALNEKKPEKRITIYKTLAKRYPKDKHIFSALGGLYKYHINMPEKAIDAYNKALELDPQFEYVLMQLSYIYLGFKNFEKALKFAKRYESASPKNANAKDTIGDIYFKMGKLDKAIEKYKEAKQGKSDLLPYSYWKIGYIFSLYENYSEASKWFNKYITVSPIIHFKTSGFYWRCFYYLWLGKIKEALVDLDKATEYTKTLEGKLWPARINLMKAWLCYHRGELDSSKSYFKTAFEMYQNILYQSYSNALDNYYQGLVNLKQGQIDSANYYLTEINVTLPDIDSAIKDEVTFYNHLLLGKVRLAEGSIGKAIKFGKTLPPLELSNFIPSANILFYNLIAQNDLLAQSYKENGELDNAISEYERKTQFDANSNDRRLINPKYHYRLARLYEETGEKQKAIQRYQKFLDIWKDADKDLQELVDAKERYAKLIKGRPNDPPQ